MKSIIAFCAMSLLWMGSIAPGAWAQDNRYGIMNRLAPSLGVTEWMHLPEGQTSLDIKDLEGKVIYLYAFQNW